MKKKKEKKKIDLYCYGNVFFGIQMCFKNIQCLQKKCTSVKGLELYPPKKIWHETKGKGQLGPQQSSV